MKENRPIVPGTPLNQKELVAELRKLTQELKVRRTLEAWRSTVVLPTTADPDAYYFLLHLDPDVKKLHVAEFKLGELFRAQEAYASAEKFVVIRDPSLDDSIRPRGSLLVLKLIKDVST